MTCTATKGISGQDCEQDWECRSHFRIRNIPFSLELLSEPSRLAGGLLIEVFCLVPAVKVALSDNYTCTRHVSINQSRVQHLKQLRLYSLDRRAVRPKLSCEGIH